MTDKKVGLLLALAGAISWSTYGTFTTIMGKYGMTEGAIAMVGPIFLLVVFLVLSLFGGGVKALSVPKKAWLFLFCNGLCAALYNYAAVRAYIHLPIGVVATIIYMNLFCLVFICRLVWKDPITKQKLLAVALAIFGVMLIVDVFGAVSDGMNAVGIFWALLAMVSWAGLMTFETLCIDGGTDENVVCMYEGVFSVIIIGVMVGPATIITNTAEVFATAGAGVLLPILAYGLITTACAYYLYMHALSKILPTYVEICYAVDPAFACIWGLLFFGQKLSGGQILGIAIVLAAVIFEQAYEIRAENRRLAAIAEKRGDKESAE